MDKIAVVTGATGGMGLEITRALAESGCRVIMACRNREKALHKREWLIDKTGNSKIEIADLDLSSLSSVQNYSQSLIQQYGSIDLLMNNAGNIPNQFQQTTEGLEKTVSTNYIGHYILSRNLASHMKPGSRIVNMISCTCRMGRLDFPDFFTHGKKGSFRRLSVYSNTKLALLLFTLELAEQLKEKGIHVNAIDPGIVSTDMISMDQWFDPLADLFFRPFIRKPLKGAMGAIHLLLKEEWSEHTGCVCINNQVKPASLYYFRHPQRKELWEQTEKLVKSYLSL